MAEDVGNVAPYVHTWFLLIKAALPVRSCSDSREEQIR